MKIRSICIGSLLCLGLGVANNAFAYLGPFTVGDTIHSYIYNKAYGTTIEVTTESQTFKGFSSQWQISNKSVGYRQNIDMLALVQNIENGRRGSAAGASHKVHINILKDLKAVGYCDLTYEYTGVFHGKSIGVFYVPPHIILNPVRVQAATCTGGYNVTTRGWLGFPNSLVLNGN